MAPTYYFFDTVGNLFKVEYPDYTGTGLFDVESYGYDADGNVTSRTDGNGVVTDYLRDDGVYNGPGSTSTPDDRLLLVQYPSTPSENVQLGYDPFERVNSEQKGAGPYTTKAYSFDDLGLPLTATFGFANGPSGKGWTYAYNPDGSRASMAYTNTIGSGNAYTYQYDALGRLTQANNPWVGGGLSYFYFANGWLNKVAASKFQSTYGYDARGNIASLLNQWSDPTNGGTLTTGSNYTGMTYDVMGNRLEESIYIPAVGSAPDASRYRYFAYDNLNQLTQDQTVLSGSGSSFYNGGLSTRTATYQYDNAGNPNTFDSLGGNLFTADNQISGTGFVYDGNGNPTTYSSSVPSSSTLSFDAENRLLSASGTSFTDDYDPDGLRSLKSTSQGTRYFVYDGDTRMLQLDASGNVVEAYGWGADGLRALYNAGDEYYQFTFDPEGNRSQRQSQYNSSAYCMDTSVYDAYGQLLGKGIVAGSPGNESEMVGFAGQWGGYTDIDQVNSAYSTGFVLMTHRFFDPKVGRFVNRDPIGYGGGLNLYAYCGNNPITGVDPSGTFQGSQTGIPAIDNPPWDSPSRELPSQPFEVTPEGGTGMSSPDSSMPGQPKGVSIVRRMSVRGAGRAILIFWLLNEGAPGLNRGEDAHLAEYWEESARSSWLKMERVKLARLNKPLQVHHFATNKSKKYTARLTAIAAKYGLGLDESWNKELLPHQGRHPYKYHDWVLTQMLTADRLARGNTVKFLEYFEDLVKQPVRDNPGRLYAPYYAGK